MLVTSGGRQVGKTSKLVKRVMEAIRKGKRVAYVSMSRQMVKISFELLQRQDKDNEFTYNLASLSAYDNKSGKGVVYFMGYGETQEIGFDRNEYDLVFIDEAQSFFHNLKPDYISVTTDEYLGGVGDFLYNRLGVEEAYLAHCKRAIKDITELDHCFFVEFLDGSIRRFDKKP